MPVITRSQSKIIASRLNGIPRNSKGHPSIGHLKPKQNKEKNPWIYDCDSLKKTVKSYIEAYESTQYVEERNKIDSSDYKKWTLENFKKLFDNVSINMKPSFEDIDDLLLLCRFLMENNEFLSYEELIINCPEKFMLVYANNSEKTPYVIGSLNKAKLFRVSKYILSFTNDSKFKTWNERRNAHIRGNLLYQALC